MMELQHPGPRMGHMLVSGPAFDQEIGESRIAFSKIGIFANESIHSVAFK